MSRMKKYGVEIVDRPKIRPTKELDLRGKEGEKLVRLLTKKILIRHEKTFKRLADM
ncbi:acetyltransferase [Acinetobacter sp.]|uniref:acetyltransferase n=2 Tax=Acinetobacter sp. TaxID=472 RepID=UPI0030149DE0